MRPPAPKAGEGESQTTVKSEVVGSVRDACTGACTEPQEEANSGAGGEHFAKALAMIAGLPLTPAEQAEAVRRLLSESEVNDD